MYYDVIGDIHGCIEELEQLTGKLGYMEKNGTYTHPDNRKIIFVGDITDRGPDSISVMELVYRLVMEDKQAYYVPGNHCNKLYRYFLGNDVQVKNGLETTVFELESLSKREEKKIRHQFIELYEQAPLYLHVKESNFLVAHAGIPEQLIGKKDKRTKSYVLYGDVTGAIDEKGRPVRLDWAKEYHGETLIIYGHTPVMEARKINQTINIDTGCVFGNKLTAYRLPEKELIDVPSKQGFSADKFTFFE